MISKQEAKQLQVQTQNHMRSNDVPSHVRSRWRKVTVPSVTEEMDA